MPLASNQETTSAIGWRESEEEEEVEVEEGRSGGGGGTEG